MTVTFQAIVNEVLNRNLAQWRKTADEALKKGDSYTVTKAQHSIEVLSKVINELAEQATNIPPQNICKHCGAEVFHFDDGPLWASGWATDHCGDSVHDFTCDNALGVLTGHEVSSSMPKSRTDVKESTF